MKIESKPAISCNACGKILFVEELRSNALDTYTCPVCGAQLDLAPEGSYSGDAFQSAAKYESHLKQTMLDSEDRLKKLEAKHKEEQKAVELKKQLQKKEQQKIWLNMALLCMIPLGILVFIIILAMNPAAKGLRFFFFIIGLGCVASIVHLRGLIFKKR